MAPKLCAPSSNTGNLYFFAIALMAFISGHCPNKLTDKINLDLLVIAFSISLGLILYVSLSIST